MSAVMMDKLLDVVVATEPDQLDEEFVAAGLAFLSLALSRLPPSEREATLRAIEDGGALRRAIRRKPSSRGSSSDRAEGARREMGGRAR